MLKFEIVYFETRDVITASYGGNQIPSNTSGGYVPTSSFIPSDSPFLPTGSIAPEPKCACVQFGGEDVHCLGPGQTFTWGNWGPYVVPDGHHWYGVNWSSFCNGIGGSGKHTCGH